MTFNDHLFMVKREIYGGKTSYPILIYTVFIGNKDVLEISILLTVDRKVVGLAANVADSITSCTLVQSVITKSEFFKAQG